MDHVLLGRCSINVVTSGTSSRNQSYMVAIITNNLKEIDICSETLQIYR